MPSPKSMDYNVPVRSAACIRVKKREMLYCSVAEVVLKFGLSVLTAIFRKTMPCYY